MASGMRILVLDELTKTGATLMECAPALRTQGAKKVFGLTLAKTGALIHEPIKINENLI
jgi:predicted amidophosphoribosyltransferase